MLGIRLKNLLLGKEQKGLWDIFTEEKQNTHLKAFDELLEAQKNQGKKFNFNDWVKGYKTLDEVALKYFKDVKVGAATQDDFINAMNKAKVTVKATGSRMENFTNGVRGFFTSLKSVTAAIGKTLAGFAANAAFYAAIAGLIKVADLAVKTAKEKTDQAVSSAQDYEKARSNVEALEGQLESIGSQIDTLQAKGHLSFTDQTELANLKTQSAELEKQLGLQQELADIKQDKAARDASEAFDAYSQQNAIDTNGEGFWTNILDSIERFAAKVNDAVGSEFAPTGGSIGLLRGHKSGTPDQILLDRIKAAKAAKKELESLQDSQTADNYDEVQKQIKEQEKVVNNYYSDLEKLYSEASQYTSSFFDPETGEALAGYEEEAKRWETVQDSYLDFFGKNKEKSKESLLNTLFSKAEFLNLEEALVDAGKQGEQAVSDLIDKTPGLTDALDEAGISADELKNHIMSIADPDAYNIKEISEQLSEAFADTDDDRLSQFEKFLSNKNPEDIEIFYKYINDGDIDLSDLTMQDVQELFLKVTADTSAADVSLEELSQKATGVVSSVESALSMLSSQSTGTSISPDLFSNDQLKDYASALEYVNGCYKLNEEAVKELTQAKVKEQIATNDAKKSLEQQEYLKNAAQIDALRHKLEQNTLASGESKESIQAQIDSLLESNSAIVSNCQQLDVLNASLRESVGLYQQWINEQNASNSGDMFDDAATAWSQLREVADSESDMYGRVGTKQYQASVDFIIPETVDHSDQEAVQNYLDGIKKYMYFDDEGNVNGLNMEQFFSDAVDKGLMVETEDSYEMAGQMTMEKFAEGMNMSLPLVQAIFGEIDEFRPEGEEWFSWADEAVQSLGDLAVVASDSADALQATEQFKDLDIQLDISGLDSKEEKLNSLDATIEQMNALYVSVRDVMIPKIQAEIDARKEGKHAEDFEYQTNWELYGINELEARLVSYQRQIDLMKEKHYDQPWKPEFGGTEASHNKQHELYKEYAGYIDAINARLKKLKAQAEEIENQIKTVTGKQKDLAEQAKIENEVWGFTKEELQDIYTLYRETDFQDSSIEVLDTDTIDDIIQLAQTLYDNAKEELEIESHPQFAYDTDMDNLYHNLTFLDKANTIDLGDFCYLELDNPSLIIRDENGAVMLDASGLHENIVPDGFIKNDMVAQGTINKDKLSFDIIEPNEFGGIISTVNKIEEDALKREIDQIRYKIIRFSKELRYGDKKSQDEYNHIFQSIDKYHTLLERVQLENGQIDIESKYIRTHYLEKLQQNDFIE